MVPLPIGQAAADDQGWPIEVTDGAAHAPHVETPHRFLASLATLLDHRPT
jgi:hypothetical protein